MPQHRPADVVPAHVAAARAAYPGITATVGDARDLPLPDGSADATLLLGPRTGFTTAYFHRPGVGKRRAAYRG
ncbi:hypothetical protein [Micromonospora sp. I033]